VTPQNLIIGPRESSKFGYTLIRLRLIGLLVVRHPSCHPHFLALYSALALVHGLQGSHILFGEGFLVLLVQELISLDRLQSIGVKLIGENDTSKQRKNL